MSLPYMVSLLLLFTDVHILDHAQANKLPKNWKTCKRNDPRMNECIKIAAEEALHELADYGNPSLGVLPLDPMHFNAIAIDQGHGPVSIKLDFINLDIIGIRTIKVKSVKTDWREMTADAEIPVLYAVGTYKVDGKVLVLLISGNGHCNLTFVGFTGTGNLKFKEIQNGEKKHYHITHFEFIFNSEKMHIYLDNLFNGDKALGDNMNKFLNENWPEILLELRPALSKAFGMAFKEVGNRLFSKVPIDQITPSDININS